MPARRIAIILIALLAVAGIVWAASNVRFVGPSETSVEAPEDVGARNGFETALGESSSGGASVIDYRRMDERLRRLSERPSMVGLAVGIIEDGEIRFLQGYGITAAGVEERVSFDTVFRWAPLRASPATWSRSFPRHKLSLSIREPLGRARRLPRQPRRARRSPYPQTHRSVYSRMRRFEAG